MSHADLRLVSFGSDYLVWNEPVFAPVSGYAVRDGEDNTPTRRDYATPRIGDAVRNAAS